MPVAADALISVAVLCMLGPAPQSSLDHRHSSPIPDGLGSNLHPRVKKNDKDIRPD